MAHPMLEEGRPGVSRQMPGDGSGETFYAGGDRPGAPKAEAPLRRCSSEQRTLRHAPSMPTVFTSLREDYDPDIGKGKRP
jgi:hypothetical protein